MTIQFIQFLIGTFIIFYGLITFLKGYSENVSDYSLIGSAIIFFLFAFSWLGLIGLLTGTLIIKPF